MRFEMEMQAVCQFPDRYRIPLSEVPGAQDAIADKMEAHGLHRLPPQFREIDVSDEDDLKAEVMGYMETHAAQIAVGEFHSGDYWVVNERVKWYSSYQLLVDGEPLTVAVGDQEGHVNIQATLTLLS